jgi:hypothetical protein
MDIIQRNLFRLLRSGAFGTQEQIEPMSAFKWERLYQIAMLHDVIPYAYQGITNCRPQFFMRLTDKQELTWKRAYEEVTAHQTEEEEEDTFLRADTLTNPVLNSQLQNILDDELSDMTTRQVLLQLIRVVRHILNEGMPIRQLLELGLLFHQHGKQVDFDQLRQWIKKLRLTQMCQLEGECLILLFGFHAEDLPFVSDHQSKRTSQIAQELLEFTNTRSHDWYFSQDADSIFVHNSNSSAMFSHVRRSSRYFRYYPSEGLTNFFASFVHSLSHIEE